MSYTDEIKKRLEAYEKSDPYLYYDEAHIDVIVFHDLAANDIKNLLEEREVLREALRKYSNTKIVIETMDVHSRSVFPEYPHAKCKFLENEVHLSRDAEEALAWEPKNLKE